MEYRNTFWILINIVSLVQIAFSQSQGDIRLSGINSNATQGRVEIFYDNEWGTVCDDGFGSTEAIVVCKQLGSPNYISAQFVTDRRFGEGTGRILMDNVVCGGTEVRLEYCPFNGWGITDCTHEEDVGVICPTLSGTPAPTIAPPSTEAPVKPDQGNCSAPDPNIRLVGPANRPGVGVVQVWNGNQWGTVCDDNWDVQDAMVVCRMLCFDASKSLAGSIAFNTDNITESMTINNVQCNGNEASISDCSQSAWAVGSCGRTEMARVTCTEMSNEAQKKPSPILDCSGGYLSAAFSRRRDQYLEEKHLSVNDTSGIPCNVVKETDIDFVTIRIPFDECGTIRTSNSTHMIYKNVIKYLPTYSVGDVSFANTYMVIVQCELPRDVFADKPIKPLTEIVTQSAPGDFIVNMYFYRNNSFSVPVTVFPLEIPLGEWLSTALELTNVDDNLRLVVPNCFATPSNNRNDSVRYPLFTDKCIDDLSVGFFPINNTWWGYRYQTFKFVAFSEVHIHCDAFICDQADTSPECDRSCFPATTTPSTTSANAVRRKRSVARRQTHVSSPTIIVMDIEAPTGIVRPVYTTQKTSTVVTSKSSTINQDSVNVDTSKKSTVKTVDSTTVETELGRTEISIVDTIYVSGNHANPLNTVSCNIFLFIFILLLKCVCV